MTVNDIDLDCAKLCAQVPPDQVVFYFRAGGDEDELDFLYAKGQLDIMGETLAELMRQNEDLELMITHAIKAFAE